jgi:hypothetical protein
MTKEEARDTACLEASSVENDSGAGVFIRTRAMSFFSV